MKSNKMFLEKNLNYLYIINIFSKFVPLIE